MNAIDLTTNFNKATSLHAAPDLFSKKRAKLSPSKKLAIDEVYDGFLKTTAVPAESKDTKAQYEDILKEHDMVAYISNITVGNATCAKKLRVGEVVTTAAGKFSKAVSIEHPVEVHEAKEEKVKETKEEEKPVVASTTPTEPAPAEEMTRTRRHEESSYAETQEVRNETPVVSAVDEASNRLLDNYLSSSAVNSNTSVEQKFNNLTKRLDEIASITEQTSTLQSKADHLLAQEQELDAKLNAAFEKSNDEYLSATQSLDEVTELVKATQDRIRQKQELLSRLNSQVKSN